MNISNNYRTLKSNMSIVMFLFILGMHSGCYSEAGQRKSNKNSQLWYEQPANVWEEALPIGNGRIGAMVFGKTSHERIQLNDDSMWPADLGWDEPAGNANDLAEIRQLLIKGKHQEADHLFVERFSRKSVVRSHQTLGDLFLNFEHDDITDYRRELDINTAIAHTNYRSKGYQISQKVYASHPHRAIVIELSSESPEGFNGTIELGRPNDAGYPTAKSHIGDDMVLVMEGEVTQRDGKIDSKPTPILNGVRFQTCLKVLNENGEVLTKDKSLMLKGVKKATIFLVNNTSFYQKDFVTQNNKDLQQAIAAGAEKIKKEHVKEYQKYYQRVELFLENESPDSLATDQRLERVKNGETDLGLQNLLFNYGRYLLISSSRPGTNPANLQGLWNQHINAPWNADYHLNINLQMNYWLANVTNLDELNEPLFDYIDRLVQNGQKTAKVNFDCQGTFVPHATDLWAPTWLRAPTAYWGCSVGAGAWLMQHYWVHYAFTNDLDFLKERAFPAIKQSALFYSDWLIEDPRDGYLVSAPSTSPENRFFSTDKKAVASCMGSAMDQQVIAEVFDHYVQACELLEVKPPLLEKIRKQRKSLRPGFVLGGDGRILEWDREYKEVEPGHRHMSHLYGFHPGTAITQSETPEIMDAVRKTLDCRLENGGAGTGWSRAWLINCYARLFDGDMAQQHIELLLKQSMYKNLFDAHPPFQIDGNFGYTAGVAEMLLQSHEKELIRILPALPSKWENGYIRGLKARGNITVDILWEDGVIKQVDLTCPEKKQIKMIYEAQTIEVNLTAGKTFTFRN
ncbi:glycosyl hydrolase family 95 catalytic domain-containing protein [Carboxylicivirga marina]|nr:glycoside hydrolase N-terminal domain-containing protein [Carboxylicivirga marina]